ncbi:MAG: universal stress protein [Thermodesulfobacteriota bacterium]
MYQSILVPLDGSIRAERILPHVEALALRFKSRVLFLQVLNPLQVANLSLHVSGIHTDLVAQSLKDFGKRYEEVQQYLAGWQGEFREKGIDARKFIEEGPIVETIIMVAKRENADLIAMASHGRSGMARVFYGSVTAGVLQMIDRPMLLIRSRNLETPA